MVAELEGLTAEQRQSVLGRVQKLEGQTTSWRLIEERLGVNTARPHCENPTVVRSGIYGGSNARLMRILVVDDNKSNLLVVREMCRKQGAHSVDIASSGPQAIEMFMAEPYDLIIMDYIMPEMNGDLATQHIKQYAHDHDLATTVLMLTASIDNEVLVSSYKAGGDLFLNKPVHFTVLHDILNTVERNQRISEFYQHKSFALAQEAMAASQILKQITHQECGSLDDPSRCLPLWSISVPSNGLISGDVLCQMEVASGYRVVLADNMGHGMPAAITTALLCVEFYRSALLPLPEAFKRINNHLKSVLPTGRFICAVLVEVNPATATAMVINAGLPPAYAGQQEVLSTYLPLGIQNCDDPPSPQAVSLADGLWIYTDGLTDAICFTNKPKDMKTWLQESGTNEQEWHDLLDILCPLDDITVAYIKPLGQN